MKTLLTAAMHRLRMRTLLLQIFGTTALLLIGFLWVEIPDSHTWQLLLTSLLGLATIAAALWLYSHVIRVTRAAADPCSRKLAVAILFGWAVLKWLLITLSSLLDRNAAPRAGYWNSQLSSHMRTIFTYEHLVAWQHDLVCILIWGIIPLLLLPFVVETVSRGLVGSACRAALRTVFRWQHWLFVLLAVAVGYTLTHGLVKWHPVHSVTGELVSVAFRISLAFLVDMFLLAVVFAIDAELLAREYIRRNTAA